VPNFSQRHRDSGDAALMMQLGAERCCGLGHLKSEDPASGQAIVQATTHYKDPSALKVTRISARPAGSRPPSSESELLQTRGW